MKQLQHIILTSMASALILSSVTACEPDATPRAKDGEKWLREFYMHYTIRGGWGFFGAEAEDKSVRVIINVPRMQAHQLSEMPDSEQYKFITSAVCPPSGENIWTILDNDGDVIVETRSGGNIFSTVPCRALNKGSHP